MKGNISLKEFVESVKNDLISAADNDNHFFHLDNVELEITFGLDASAKAGAKLFVVEFGGEAKASQVHKVKLTLTPLTSMSTKQNIKK